jgi:hypothetical protein
VGAPVSHTDPANYFGAIPSTAMQVLSFVWENTAYGNVRLTIQDKNDGNVPLTNCVVHLNATGVEYPWSPLGNTGLPAWVTFNESGTTDGIMAVNETWTWVVDVSIGATTTFEIQGEARFEPLDLTVDGPSEYASITVEVGGATRTWGFWKTHLYLVQWMFNATAPGSPHITSIYLGTWKNYTGVQQIHNITTVCRYMGLMWSDQSKSSNRAMRTNIDNARIHTAHQALAAIMNSLMPGGAPLPGGITLGSIATTLSSNNITAIRNLGSALADFNESHEDVALGPSLPATGKVTGNIGDPQGARLAGATCIPYWDTPRK